MDEQVVKELAPTGKLRAGINMSNFLLVTGKAATGDPQGVSPDMAAEVARRLGVPLQLVPFPSPGQLADAVANAPTVQGQVLLSLFWSVAIMIVFVPLAIRVYRKTVT